MYVCRKLIAMVVSWNRLTCIHCVIEAGRSMHVFFFPLQLFILCIYKHIFSAEEEVLPGRPLPPECHAELHTDYDGAAVRWGLTHHEDSAADCCQACLDQARHAKEGEKKCNIWVYCPSEFGCHSPDIYQHKHQECWLKYVSCTP